MSDENYYPPDFEQASSDYISLEYKEKIVALAQAHPKWSLSTFQKNGATRLKRKDHLQRWKEDVLNGGTMIDKLKSIDSETFKRFEEARNSFQQVKMQKRLL